MASYLASLEQHPSLKQRVSQHDIESLIEESEKKIEESRAN